MSGLLLRTALRRSLDQVLYVSPIRPGLADGLVADVYREVERDFGMLAPPVALHSPAPGPLAACWLMLRETLLAAGLAGRGAKEAVAAAVSLANTCPYCVAVHAATMHSLVRGPAAEAIAADRIGSVTDPVMREVAAWARASGQRDQARPLHAPYSDAKIAELAGVAVTFQYLNRMVNVFLADSPLPPGVPRALAGGLMRVLGWFMRSAAHPAPDPGTSLGLLPAAPVPGDMGWARGNPRVADAFARAAGAIELAAAAVVPAGVRELVESELAGWTGQPPGLSRGWAAEAAGRLAGADRPAGRLALLTAIASYQVSPADIEDYRRAEPGDDALIAFTSWASLAAARTAGHWLEHPGEQVTMAAPRNTGDAAAGRRNDHK